MKTTSHLSPSCSHHLKNVYIQHSLKNIWNKKTSGTNVTLHCKRVIVVEDKTQTLYVSDALQQGASQFEQQAGKLKRKYWWKNLKVCNSLSCDWESVYVYRFTVMMIIVW